MGPIGAQEMFFIVLLALLLFGPKKLPELGRLLGKGLTEFRRAKNELKSTFETHMQELEREARISEQNEAAKNNQTAAPQYSSATYPYAYDEYGRQSDDTAQPAEAEKAPQPEPVSGTVPRGKPAQSAEPVSTATEQNHPA